MKSYINILFTFLLVGLFGSGLQAQDLLTKQHQLPCLNKTLSIVAHVVVNEAGETNIEMDSIMAALDTLNKDFAPICVSFEICQFDTIANYQYDTVANYQHNGMERMEWDELQTVYHEENRINLYFVSSFESNPATYCGFATQDGIFNIANGGLVVLKDCESPMTRALSHQMGHYFGLLNTFNQDQMGFNTELVNGSNCEDTGDSICDTAADPYILGTDPLSYVNVDLNCRFINTDQDQSGDYYVPDVGNIMSFYPAECKCGFTLGQYVQMAANCEAASDMW